MMIFFTVGLLNFEEFLCLIINYFVPIVALVQAVLTFFPPTDQLLSKFYAYQHTHSYVS